MPYFVYRILERPIRRLEKMEQHDAFREASNRAKKLRGAQGSDASALIKVIFAENELQAEDLLNQVRAAAHDSQDD